MMNNPLLRLGKFGLDSHLLEREVLARGLCTLRFSPTAFLAGPSRERASDLGFYYTASNLTSKVGREIAGDQQRTRSVLAEAGVAVPAGRAFGAGRIRHARRYAEQLGYPVVVKPSRGRLGTGVSTNLTDDAAVDAAIAALGLVDDAEGRFVVEKHHPGSTFRVLVVENRAQSVLRRVPATVVGDGARTAGELVAMTNEVREHHPYLRNRPIDLDADALARLAERGLRPDSVVPAGLSVPLRGESHASLDGDLDDVTGEAHPQLIATAEAAVAALPGIHHAGVDVVAIDHRDVQPDWPAVVVDVDVVPHLAPHEFPSHGDGRPVTRALIDAHIEAAPATEFRHLDVSLVGSPRPQSLSKKVNRLAAEFDVAADVNVDDQDGNVSAQLVGPLELISVITALATVGSRAPEMIETVPWEVSA